MNRLTLRPRDRVRMIAPFALVETFVPGASLATLVEQTDQALNRAKSNGRDCLELVPATV